MKPSFQRYKKPIIALVATGSVLASLFANQIAQAASDTASALATVIAALSITHVSDLDFGEGVQGDTSKVVAAGTVENAENASFNLAGEPSRGYTITLPSSVTMQTAGGGTNKDIVVNSFTSYPSATGTLDGAGTGLLLVGATRAALGAAQVTGSYSASFTVTVVY